MSVRRLLLACALLVGLLTPGALAGAWGDFYNQGDMGEPGTPRAHAIIEIKRQLDSRGYGKNLVLDSPVFGDATGNRVGEFQADHALPRTERVGPDTARALFRSRVYVEENVLAVPNHLGCRTINLESAFDPGATGSVNGEDRGLGQINATAHPDVTDAQAFDARFSIRWVTRYLRSAYDHFVTLTARPWRAALAAYNTGWGGAQKWLDAGAPDSPDEATSDPVVFRAARYIRLVLSRAC